MVSRSVTIIATFAIAVLGLAASAAKADLSIDAIARPSEDTSLTFVHPGRVDKILVKKGDDVQQGQVLAAQDDTAEQIQLKQLKAEADDNVRIRAAEAQLALKKVIAQRLEEAAAHSGAASKLEIEQARLDAEIEQMRLELAKLEKEQARLKYEEAKAQVDRMRIISPFAGKVEEINIKLGESAEGTTKTIRLVKVDPLWVDVPVPTELSKNLKVGQSLHVLFDDSPSTSRKGKIIYIAAVADSASQTRMVQVEVPNAGVDPAGTHVQIEIPGGSSSGQALKTQATTQPLIQKE